MMTLLLFWATGYVASLVCLIRYKIREEEKLSLGDAVSAVWISAFSWIVVLIWFIFTNEWDDIIIYRKKKIK